MDPESLINSIPSSAEELIAFLHQVPLFADLPRGELKFLAHTLGRQSFEPGQVVFREGEVGEAIYFVLGGAVDVLMAMDTPDEKFLSQLHAGDYAGEMSLIIPGGKRSASFRAAERSELLVLTREDFDDLLHRQPQIAYNMIRIISTRLRNSDSAAFRDLREKNRQLQKAYDELKAAHEQIIEKERLEKELQLAADIQLSILPRSLPVLPGVNFGGYMAPARRVGGDLYDIFQLDDERVGLLIGDVTDKGVPSAIFMARSHALLTSEGLRGAAPAEALRSVNAYLTRLEQSDLFVTVLYGIFDAQAGTFAYARAGHELPLLVNSAGEVEQMPLGKSLPLGIDGEIPLDEYSVQVPPGGSLLLFTDGLCDCRNPQGEEFGHERIISALAALHGLPAKESCEDLVQTLNEFRQGAVQDDDITLVILHRE